MKSPNQQQRNRRRGRCKQLGFVYRTWGGKRKGAGRKPKGEQAGVSHRARTPIPSGCPVHVTTRLCDGLPGLRRRKLWKSLRRVFFAMHDRAGFRIVHFSIQQNHVHLVVEAAGREALARGMQSFKIRFAKTINAYLGRDKGTVFADRYHMRILRTPTQTRNAIAYVVLNSRRHGEDRGVPRPERWLDPYSSAPFFDGWRERGLSPPPGDDERPVQVPGSWLLSEGWRRGRGGRISILEVPGPWPG